MSQQRNTLICALGAAVIGSFVTIGTVNASENPFGISQLDNSYMQVAMDEGKCGAKKAEESMSKCGAKKEEAEHEGKCGAKKEMEKKEGKCGAKKEEAEHEGKCGAKK
jgi:uncharacterized low-complexity protein